MTEWQALENGAIWRKHQGDIDGAIAELQKAIRLTRAEPQLAERTAISLNYLADLHLLNNDLAQAEEAVRQALDLSRSLRPGLHADNLWILAEIQSRKGDYREALASAAVARELYEQQGQFHGVAQAEELMERIQIHF